MVGSGIYFMGVGSPGQRAAKRMAPTRGNNIAVTLPAIARQGARPSLLLATLLAMLAFLLTSPCAGQATWNRDTRANPAPSYRTVVTYDGQVCIVGDHFDMMSDGRVVFKEDGMRFTSQGYVWSPVIPDKVVRQGHYYTRIVGSPTDYWPPLSPTDRRTSSASPMTLTTPATTTQTRRQPSGAPAALTTPSFTSGLLETAKAYNAAQVPTPGMPIVIPPAPTAPTEMPQIPTTPTVPIVVPQPTTTAYPEVQAPSPVGPDYCTPMSTLPECQAYVRRYRRW